MVGCSWFSCFSGFLVWVHSADLAGGPSAGLVVVVWILSFWVLDLVVVMIAGFWCFDVLGLVGWLLVVFLVFRSYVGLV